MRMFLIGMTDIFLILYLTSVASAPTRTVLTMGDFLKLKAMHETLQSDKQKEEEKFREELRLARKEKADLAGKLSDSQAQAKEKEKSLSERDARLAQVNQELQSKEALLKQREESLQELDQNIKAKEVMWQGKETVWQKKEASYQKKLEQREISLDASQMVAQKIRREAQKTERWANQLKKKAIQAYQAAEEAEVVQQDAVVSKEAALKEKEEAERTAREAMDSRRKAEEEKERALKAAEEAKRIKEQLKQKADKLASSLKAVKQDSDAAYQKNLRPLMQEMNVTYEQMVSNSTTVYKRQLALLPVRINDRVFVFFPSAHVGFSRRSDSAPQGLEIMYKGKKVTHGWINEKDDLIAIELPDYKEQACALYPKDTDIDQMMPVLLALRNNGDREIWNLFRGLSNEYFVVNRDNIRREKNGELIYAVTGFRGTGMRAEKIIQGDQVVDLSGRFIGVAKNADHIVRIDSLKGWKERDL